MMDLQIALENSLPFIHDASNFMRLHFGKVVTNDIIAKGHNSLVSYVDRGAEEILVRGLSTILPEAGFITEEETTSQGQKEFTWVIDPLDGTTNYLHGIPQFSISVGLYDGQNVVLGIVLDVMNRDLYTAIKGHGAFCNEIKIQVTDEPDFAQCLVGTGFPYKKDHTVAGHFAALEQVLTSTRGIRRLGSAALDLCHVASGKFGAFYEHTLNSYDISAGSLIVQEAGGVVTDYRGGDQWLFEGEVLACAPQYQDRMVEILRAFE